MTVMLGLTVSAYAEDVKQPQEPVHYTNPQDLIAAADKVKIEFKKDVNYKIIDGAALSDHKEVREFYSSFCGHCHALKPFMDVVLLAMPEDTSFVLNPVHYLGGPMGPELQKDFAVALSLNVSELFQNKIDKVIWTDNKIPQSHEDVLKIFEEIGVPSSTVETQYKSFPIMNIASDYVQKTTDANIQGVPAVVVNNKYIVINSSVPSEDQFMALINYLLKLDSSSYDEKGNLKVTNSEK